MVKENSGLRGAVGVGLEAGGAEDGDAGAVDLDEVFVAETREGAREGFAGDAELAGEYLFGDGEIKEGRAAGAGGRALLQQPVGEAAFMADCRFTRNRAGSGVKVGLDTRKGIEPILAIAPRQGIGCK